MIKSKPATKKKSSKPTKTIEWILTELDGPGYVADEETPYRPRLVICMDTESEYIICLEAVRDTSEVSMLANRILKDAFQDYPHKKPTHIRTSSSIIAQSIQTNYPNITLIQGDTPEVDIVVKMMISHFNQEEDSPDLYLNNGVSKESVSGFFKAASQLYKTAPWQILPSDVDIMSLTIPELGIENYVISVIGQQRQNMGVTVFYSISDFESFLTLAEDIGDDGLPDTMIPSIALNYDRGADVHPDLKKEIMKNKWEVASPEAYPWIMPIDKDFVRRPLTEKDYLMFEAISLALAEFVQDAEGIKRALITGEKSQKTITANTTQGSLKVTMGFPFEL